MGSITARALIAILAFALSACVEQQVQGFVPFAPKAEIRDQIAFNADLAVCRSYAIEYLEGQSALDPVSVASATAQGALNNLADIAVSPLATGLSGIGGGSSEATAELGLSSVAGKRIVAICMHDRGKKSGNYTIMAPEL